jgi:hypothetical protein
MQVKVMHSFEAAKVDEVLAGFIYDVQGDKPDCYIPKSGNLGGTLLDYDL